MILLNKKLSNFFQNCPTCPTSFLKNYKNIQTCALWGPRAVGGGGLKKGYRQLGKAPYFALWDAISHCETQHLIGAVQQWCGATYTPFKQCTNMVHDVAVQYACMLIYAYTHIGQAVRLNNAPIWCIMLRCNMRRCVYAWIRIEAFNLCGCEGRGGGEAR